MNLLLFINFRSFYRFSCHALRAYLLYELIADKDINAALREHEKEQGTICSTQWPEMVRDAGPNPSNLTLKLDNGNRRMLLKGENNAIRVHAPLLGPSLRTYATDHRRYICVPTFARKCRPATDRSLFRDGSHHRAMSQSENRF